MPPTPLRHSLGSALKPTPSVHEQLARPTPTTFILVEVAPTSCTLCAVVFPAAAWRSVRLAAAPPGASCCDPGPATCLPSNVPVTCLPGDARKRDGTPTIFPSLRHELAPPHRGPPAAGVPEMMAGGQLERCNGPAPGTSRRRACYCREIAVLQLAALMPGAVAFGCMVLPSVCISLVTVHLCRSLAARLQRRLWATMAPLHGFLRVAAHAVGDDLSQFRQAYI